MKKITIMAGHGSIDPAAAAKKSASSDNKPNNKKGSAKKTVAYYIMTALKMWHEGCIFGGIGLLVDGTIVFFKALKKEDK